MFCSLSEVYRERMKPHIFRKHYILSRGGVLLTETPQDPKRGRYDAAGVRALVGMPCSPCHQSYRNNHCQGIIPALGTETLVWP